MFLLNLCDIDRLGLQVHSFEVRCPLCSFSDVPVSGRSFCLVVSGWEPALKLLKEYSALGDYYNYY